MRAMVLFSVVCIKCFTSVVRTRFVELLIENIDISHLTCSSQNFEKNFEAL